ncbi:hypothetical protein O3G_MSEX002839 [Manduca sexta]|uniref:Uncharacterized protein n=1 Tax=Manduca sexta TaxID=7130 RepID=A0A921YPS5_MANSE|nr:hypothetical protein O3G_MSEX002839 [Manduca sexta]
MKLLVLLLLFVLATLSDARGNISIGDNFGAKLIYHETRHKIGIPLMRRDEKVTVKGVGSERIKSILVQDLKGDGESYIMSGGVGHSSVTIKLKGPKGKGYKFLIDVYAI